VSDVEPRFLYVAELFCDGTTELFVPDSEADEGNAFPMKGPDGAYRVCPQYVLGSFEVDAAGTLVAIAASSKPSDSRALAAGRLESLFASPAVVARGPPERLAWSVQRVSLVPVGANGEDRSVGGMPCLAGGK
jgi:hypothetical protein